MIARVHFFLWVALLLFSSSLVAAAQPGSASDDLEARARALASRLMAPCCFTQTVAQHESAAAQEMRVEVRQLLAQGLTDEQIIDHYVERYGPRILAVPPAQGFNQLLYSMPFLVTLCLLIGVCLALWKWYQRGHSAGAA